MFTEKDDKGNDTAGTDKFKGLLIAFIIGNVVIWMAPEIVATMDPCLDGSHEIGYLPILEIGDAPTGIIDTKNRPGCAIGLNIPLDQNDQAWEQANFASAYSQAIIQTVFFVVKIIMVLGVIGAVGIMRFRRPGLV